MQLGQSGGKFSQLQLMDELYEIGFIAQFDLISTLSSSTRLECFDNDAKHVDVIFAMNMMFETQHSHVGTFLGRISCEGCQGQGASVILVVALT